MNFQGYSIGKEMFSFASLKKQIFILLFVSLFINCKNVIEPEIVEASSSSVTIDDVVLSSEELPFSSMNESTGNSSSLQQNISSQDLGASSDSKISSVEMSSLVLSSSSSSEKASSSELAISSVLQVSSSSNTVLQSKNSILSVNCQDPKLEIGGTVLIIYCDIQNLSTTSMYLDAQVLNEDALPEKWQLGFCDWVTCQSLDQGIWTTLAALPANSTKQFSFDVAIRSGTPINLDLEIALNKSGDPTTMVAQSVKLEWTP